MLEVTVTREPRAGSVVEGAKRTNDNRGTGGASGEGAADPGCEFKEGEVGGAGAGEFGGLGLTV